MKHDRHITDARVAKALLHPLRVRILRVLDERIASPSQIAQELDASLGVVSYHVRTLARLGFVELVDEQQRRGAIEHFYRAAERPVVTSEAWGQMPTVAKHAMVRVTLAQIAEQVNQAAAGAGFERPEVHLTRSPLVLDEQGWAQVSACLDAALEELERVTAESERRLTARDHAGEIRATAVLMLFESPGEPSAANGGAHAGAELGELTHDRPRA